MLNPSLPELVTGGKTLHQIPSEDQMCARLVLAPRVAQYRKLGPWFAVVEDVFLVDEMARGGSAEET
jgi:hypothetical protein